MSKTKAPNGEDKHLHLVLNIKNKNCSDSFSALSELFVNYYFNITKRYSAALKRVGMSQEDIAEEREYVLWKAIESYNPTKGAKFATWFCNVTRYYFLNFISKNKKNIISDSPADKDSDFNKLNLVPHYDANTELYDYFDKMLSNLSDSRTKEVYKLRYFSGGEKLATWSMVAKKLNISSQTAINLHNRAKPLLRNKVESKENYDLV